MSQRVPRRANIPDVRELTVLELREMRKAIVVELERRVAKDEPYDEILISSPNGTIYAINVSDKGVLSTVLRYQVT